MSFFSGLLNGVNSATDIWSGAIDVIAIKDPVCFTFLTIQIINYM